MRNFFAEEPNLTVPGAGRHADGHLQQVRRHQARHILEVYPALPDAQSR